MANTAHALRHRNPQVGVFAVEPAESAVLSGKPSGSKRSRGSASASFRPCGSPTKSMRF